MNSVYKNAEARAEMLEVTNGFRRDYVSSCKDHYLESSYGRSYVAEVGDAARPTIVLLHGGMTNHAFILYVFRHLLPEFHIYCPDLPGHAGFSAESRLDPRGDDFGHWMNEIMVGLDLNSASFVGVSYGAFVCNRMIATNPEKVERAALIVPGGIIPISSWSLVRHVFLWQALHSVFGHDYFFEKIMEAFFTDCNDEDVKRSFRQSFFGMNIDTRQMKLTSPQEVSSFNKPVLIVGAENDVVFPWRALSARARKLYPRATIERLPGSKHSPSIEAANLLSLNQRVMNFLMDPVRVELAG